MFPRSICHVADTRTFMSSYHVTWPGTLVPYLGAQGGLGVPDVQAQGLALTGK
jgi:hypothetical protein